MWGQLWSQKHGNYKQNVILSKPRVVSASGTWSGLNPTQFYIQMCHLIELNREILHTSVPASSSVWIYNHNSRWVNIVVVARAPDLNVIHPSAVDVFLLGGETEPRCSLRNQTWAVQDGRLWSDGLKLHHHSDELGKCWPAGENGRNCQRGGGGGRRSILDNPLFSQSDLQPVQQL